jgi:hypothetical protein
MMLGVFAARTQPKFHPLGFSVASRQFPEALFTENFKPSARPSNIDDEAWLNARAFLDRLNEMKKHRKTSSRKRPSKARSQESLPRLQG